MAKNSIFIILIVAILFGCTSCGAETYIVRSERDKNEGAGAESENPTAKVAEEQNPTDNGLTIKEDECNSISATFLQSQHSYATANNIPLRYFSEQRKLSDWYEENASDLRKLSENLLFLDTVGVNGNQYVLTRKESDYYYIGELIDNKPNGYGMILQNDSVIDRPTDEKNFVYLYIGSFEKGRYEGYGMLFDIPTLNNGGKGDLNTILNHVTSNIQSELFRQWYLGGANYVTYEGMFKDGHRNGYGNAYYTSLDGVAESGLDSQDIVDKGITYSIDVGEFKDDQLNGHAQQYYAGYLYYDGKMKEDEKSGKGKEYYFRSNQLLYEGEFKRDYYEGTGTMYAEDGSIIYKGKWRNGDYN